MTDMTNKNVIITGGNSGIGLEAAVVLAKLGATVVIACRNPTKANAALSEIVQRSQGGNVSTMSLDLASFASIRGFAKEAIDRFENLRSQKLGVRANDLRIAAIALVNGATVDTRNVADFSRIPGLLVENWAN